ncbi:DUF6174 domain-containing protein [Streptomyces indiaensis]|uniref:Lipoprotein n=1 Tax=Streptomyces indiaensis TaxID=284033 RepID=A0ABP5R2J0_9ACTN|nr:DUF6174 domain-containing protein [Streptomyces indiaensis]MCF1649205.1 DUF6174 domain-containing protein [Streptomyces indiaensis]
MGGVIAVAVVEGTSAMTAMTRAARAVRATVLIAGTVGAAAACGTAPTSPEAENVPGRVRGGWQEPAAYTYTLRSSEGERSLLGTFRISVREGVVVKAVGLDDSARRAVESAPGSVPTLGELLAELEQARRDHAHTAEARYAADGHPVRIVLDREENAVDDEARYDITAYRPAHGRRAGDPAGPRPAA